MTFFEQPLTFNANEIEENVSTLLSLVRTPPRTKYTKIKCKRSILDLQWTAIIHENSVEPP